MYTSKTTNVDICADRLRHQEFGIKGLDSGGDGGGGEVGESAEQQPVQLAPKEAQVEGPCDGGHEVHCKRRSNQDLPSARIAKATAPAGSTPVSFGQAILWLYRDLQLQLQRDDHDSCEESEERRSEDDLDSHDEDVAVGDGASSV